MSIHNGKMAIWKYSKMIEKYTVKDYKVIKEAAGLI